MANAIDAAPDVSQTGEQLTASLGKSALEADSLLDEFEALLEAAERITKSAALSHNAVKQEA
jgi:hypothetical protein